MANVQAKLLGCECGNQYVTFFNEKIVSFACSNTWRFSITVSSTHFTRSKAMNSSIKIRNKVTDDGVPYLIPVCALNISDSFTPAFSTHFVIEYIDLMA